MSQPLEDMHRSIDSVQEQFAAARAQIERARDLGDRLKDVVGRAESEDGNIRVEHSVQGVQDLVLEPRAMRMASEDLAATILSTLRDAATDFQQQTLQAMQDAGAAPNPDEQRRDLDQAIEQLGGAQQELSRSLSTAAQAITRANSGRRPQL